MSEVKFTKGPWVWDDRYPTRVFSDDATGSLVALCHGKGFEYVPRDSVEATANAHLIAAAPELYEALIKLHNLANHFCIAGVYFTEDDINFEALEKAELALAKARGES